MLRLAVGVVFVALVVACADVPSAVEPAAGPTFGQAWDAPAVAECLPADRVVSDWAGLQAALDVPNQVTAVAGTIEVPAGVVENVVGLTLTCASPGATLALEGALTLSGGPIVLEGLTIVTGSGSLGISSWPDTPIRLRGNLFIATGAGTQVWVGNSDGAVIAGNVFLTPSGAGGIPLSVGNATAPTIMANTFSTTGYSLAQLLLHQATDVVVSDNRFLFSEAPMFSAIHVQAYGPWSGQASGRITNNFIQTERPSSASVSRGTGIAVVTSKSSGMVVTRNTVLGPWAYSLATAGCDGDWTENAIDGGDSMADVSLRLSACNNRVLLTLKSSEDGFGPFGPQVTVMDLGTDNTILGVANLKRGAAVAPPAPQQDVLCLPGQACTP